MNWLTRIETIILRTLLACPRSVQQLLAGKTWQLNERKMDCQMQLLSMLARRKPTLNRLSVAQARRAVRDGVAMFHGKDQGVSYHNRQISQGGCNVTVRVYQPNGLATHAPAILYFHMGGFVVGDLDTNHEFCKTLALSCGAKVYSVLYRKAPEHPITASLQDAQIAHQWLRENCANEKIDANRIAIAGDSAGGAISALLCQYLKAQQLPQPKVQLLVYPLTDNGPHGDSWYQCQHCYPLTMPEAQWFEQQQYIANSDPNAEFDMPLQSDDLTGLAPAIVVTAGFDLLRDQGRSYGEQLTQAGVSVIQMECSGLSHGFTALANGVDGAKQANQTIANTLKRWL